VEVVPVTQENVQLQSEWVATLDGSVNAQIEPQVTGYLVRQNYKEGSFVRKSQVLFEIDPRPFKAALDRAQGDLAQAVAQLGKSTLDVERDTALAASRAVARSQLDNEIQAKLGAQAAVESGKAAVEQAQLNLGFTKVTSLVDGIAGVAQTQIGNLVKPETVLTTVFSVNPIRVYFPISEREYLDLAGVTGAADNASLLHGAKAPPLDDSHRGRVSEPDQRSSPRGVWPRSDRLHRGSRRTPHSSTRGHRYPRQVSGGGCELRQQGAGPAYNAGSGDRNALHREERSTSGGTSGGGRHGEGV
jgi:RND family efflux transporter MFP subunit